MNNVLLDQEKSGRKTEGELVAGMVASKEFAADYNK
jgi:hypothetical protein